MSVQHAHTDTDADPHPQAWLRYRGRTAVIEATGTLDERVEGPLLALAGSAASRGSSTVLLNVSRARLDECSIPIIARMQQRLEESSVVFGLAGQSSAARELLARADGDLHLVLYPSVTAPPPWSSTTTGNVVPRHLR